MAKLERITGKIFGATASSSGDNPDIGQFGSAKAGTYNGTGDVAEIQALSAWGNGWIDAVTPTQQFPTLPEMTGVHKVLSYQNAYLLKEGMPEYDAGTIYDIGGMCKIGKIIYYCTSDNNANNPQTLNGWIVYYDPDATESNLIPFCINSGSVNSNGDGNCLTLPSGSTAVVTRNFVRPNLTADGTLGGDYFAVSANIYYNYHAYLAFDGNNNTYWECSYAPTATNYMIFYNPVELNVTELDVIVYGPTNSIGTYNDNINIYGSNDNATWEQLASNIPSGAYGYYQYQYVNIDLSSNTNSYKYYKIENTASSYSQYFGYCWGIANVNITATYQETIVSSENLILGGHTVPVVLTNAKGLTSVINEDLTKDVSSGYADGDYNIYVSIEDGELSAYGAKLYRQPTQPSGTNVATSTNAISSGSYSGQPLANAFDGSLTTFWGCSQLGSNQINGVAYIGQSNLTKPIKKVRLYQSYTGFTLPASTYCDVIKLQYSNDGTTWIDIQTVSNLTYLTWEEIDVQDYTPTGSQHSFRLLAMNFPYSTSSYNWIVGELELLTLEDNTVWLDTSVRPLSAYKYNGSTWQEFTGVPVGTCTVASNIVTAVKTFAYNVNGIENSLIKNYQNSVSGYTLEWRYNSYNQKIMRYCIQYGTFSTGTGLKYPTLLISYGTNTNYFISFTAYGALPGEGGYHPLPNSITPSSFVFDADYTYGGLWKTEGWIEE